jgi:glucose-specific phosphotransferase system IIA component
LVLWLVLPKNILIYGGPQMFGFFRKSYSLLAPVDGKIIELSRVPDPIFSEKMAGDGIALETSGDTFVSPADGILTLIFNTNHAFALTLDNGAEILVHIGLNTVELKGEGFERIAKVGEHVKAGDPVVKVDRKFVTEKGYSLITPVLITNLSNNLVIKGNVGQMAKAGETEALTYKIK